MDGDLTGQERSEESSEFLKGTNGTHLKLSEFSLYSIGIILTGLDKTDLPKKFLSDVRQSGVSILRLRIEDFDILIEARRKYKLDFDDAYQYAAAEKYGLKIVSFDSDFDGTELGRITPADVVNKS